MKFHGFVTTATLITLFTALATGQKPAEKPQSEAQKSFTQLKSLAGNWEGPATTDPPIREMGNGARLRVSLRVTARGNALALEWHEAGKSEETSPSELTMFYVDGDRFLLTHFCEAGNQPRMVGKVLPDGKTMEFDLQDITGSTQRGYLHHAVLTIIDENHHTEDWFAIFPGDKRIRGHFDLQRAKDEGGASGK